jgi:hypothetical protein
MKARALDHAICDADGGGQFHGDGREQMGTAKGVDGVRCERDGQSQPADDALGCKGTGGLDGGIQAID